MALDPSIIAGPRREQDQAAAYLSAPAGFERRWRRMGELPLADAGPTRLRAPKISWTRRRWPRARDRAELEAAMGDVVNLNKFRKRKAKAERAKRAEVNRRLHGRNKAERAQDELLERQLTRHLDGARLERTPPSDDTLNDEPPSSSRE